MKDSFKNNTTGICDFPNEIYLGGVEVWLSELSSTGLIQGFRCMGCAEDATITRDETKLEVDKACEGIRETLEFITKTKQTLKFTVQNATLQNIAEFLAGTADTYTNPAVAGVADVKLVRLVANGGVGAEEGQTYLLADSSGKRILDIDKTKLTVSHSADESMWSTLTITTDYTVDEAAGSIYLVIGGGVNSGDALKFTLAADAGATSSISRSDSGSVGKRYVALRLRAHNGIQNEAEAEVLIYACFLGSDGDLALSGTDIMKLGFTGTMATSSLYGTSMHVVNVPN